MRAFCFKGSLFSTVLFLPLANAKKSFFFLNVAHCSKNISYSAVWFKSTYFGEKSMLSVMNDIMMYFFYRHFRCSSNRFTKRLQRQ